MKKIVHFSPKKYIFTHGTFMVKVVGIGIMGDFSVCVCLSPVRFILMTIKEAILKSLEDIKGFATSFEVYKHIIDHNYIDFKKAKTPERTIAAQLGEFERSGDTQVKRVKQDNGKYSYCLAKNEQAISYESKKFQNEFKRKNAQTEKKKTFEERDLHRLLSSYLKKAGVYTKTIFHEQSNNKGNNQIWTHPDMVGIQFLKLKNKTSQKFLKTINRIDTFKLNSYELKKEINNDSELKKAFFQAVSNSSWANYGYLVAFKINDDLIDEMERLNQSFGIGIIELNANLGQNRILFQAKYRELDFKTIDKLCEFNKEFEHFIEQAEKSMSMEEQDYDAILNNFCDKYFNEDKEVQKYCREKNISSAKNRKYNY